MTTDIDAEISFIIATGEHVNKIPTSCFRLNVFRLKKLNKRDFNDIGVVISKQKSCKSRMITIIKLSQKQRCRIKLICALVLILPALVCNTANSSSTSDNLPSYASDSRSENEFK